MLKSIEETPIREPPEQTKVSSAMDNYENCARDCGQSFRCEQFLTTVISAGRSGHRHSGVASATGLRMTLSVQAVDALRPMQRVRDMRCHFGALARLAEFT